MFYEEYVMLICEPFLPQPISHNKFLIGKSFADNLALESLVHQMIHPSIMKKWRHGSFCCKLKLTIHLPPSMCLLRLAGGNLGVGTTI